MEFKIHDTKHFKEYKKGEQDCWTLLQDVFMENGIILPDYIDVRTPLQRDKFKEYLVDNLSITEVDKLERGAIILFETNPWHCGLALDDKNMIHRAENINTRTERVDRYGKKIAGIYLVKKSSPK